MGKYSDCEKTDIEILMELHIFSMSEYEKLDFGMLSVCMWVCVYIRLASSRMIEVFLRVCLLQVCSQLIWAL
jgi:hypothetical protein